MTKEEREAFVQKRKDEARKYGESLERRWPGQDIEGRTERAEKYARWELAGKP